MDISSKDMAETLAPYWPIDHTINLERSLNSQSGRTWNHSEVELNTVKAYLEPTLDNGIIMGSLSHPAATIIFAKNKDRGLPLCGDNRALKRVTVMNPYRLE